MKTMKSKRRISTVLSTVLSISMLAGVLSTTALAAETTEQTETEQTAGKAINLGTSAVSNYNSTKGYDYVYFGVNGSATNPIKWRVLHASQTNTGTEGMFLLTENTIAEVKFSDNKKLYQDSEIRKWLRKVSGEDTTQEYSGLKIFKPTELEALLETTKDDTGGNWQLPETNILNGDKLFLLSNAEAHSSQYGMGTNANRKVNRQVWYTRSTYYHIGDNQIGTDNSRGLVITENGSPLKTVKTNQLRLRPACNVDLDKILFTSAANNSGHKEKFTTPDTYYGRDWKLTLKDGNNFADGASISDNTALDVGYSDATLTVNHKALSTISNGYTNVTAVLSDESGNIIRYGSINPDTAATTSTVTIPSGLTAGTYTLSIYGEDWNEANFTDYATGTPFTQEITVTAKSNVKLGDVNGDGSVNMKDLALLQQYLAGLQETIVTENSDINKDGSVNIKDLSLLQQYLAGLREIIVEENSDIN